MLFVVGAMAALSIDVVTFYTARSEAQMAADSAALAAARVLANSGMTSSTRGHKHSPGRRLPKQLATTSPTRSRNRISVGGQTAAQVNVSFSNDDPIRESE